MVGEAVCKGKGPNGALVTLRPLRGRRRFGGIPGVSLGASLNPRLIAGIPPGSGMTGGFVAGSVNADGGSLGWRGLPGSVSPATTEVARRAQGVAGDD